MEKLKNLKRKVATWSETRGARVIIGLLALALAWLFLEWAFDSGSLLDYSIAITLIIFGLREWVVAALPPAKGGDRRGRTRPSQGRAKGGSVDRTANPGQSGGNKQ